MSFAFLGKLLMENKDNFEKDMFTFLFLVPLDNIEKI